MKTETARLLRALFYAYVAFTFVHIAYVVYHEPFAFDAWNMAVDTKAQPASVHNFFAFWHQQYAHANPRIGEEMAYLAYKVTPVAELGTPLAFLAIVLGGFMFGVGRRPRLDNLCDLATLSIGIGIFWIAAPNLPAYMFCRAYATNYIWLAAFQLWFLVPLRMLDPAAPAKVSIGKLAGYFVLGVVSGMGNEHVGPTMILLVVGYGVWIWRKHHTRPALLWIGVIGLFTGYALVFFAPGQSQRYEGLGEQHTLMGQILVRGLNGNMNIYLDLFHSLGALLALFVCIVGVGMLYPGADSESAESRVRQRAAVRTVVIALVAGSLITITVFASPKLGPRFYLHSCLLAAAALQGVVSAFLSSRRAFRPFVIFAVLCSLVAAARTIPMYTRLKQASDARLATLAATPIGEDTSLDPWEQVGEDWWFLGDDLRDQKKQELVSNYFALHRVLFRAGDALKMLGRQDVKARLHYKFANPQCMDEIEHLDLPEFIGRDVSALLHAFLDDIADIQRFGNKLETIDMTVDFLARQPPMPAKTIYIGRWDHGELEGYTARLKRSGRSKRREIVLDPKLKLSPWQIYLVVVGEQPKLLGTSTDDKPLAYTPWSAGQYWTLACRDDYCFLLLAVVHTL